MTEIPGVLANLFEQADNTIKALQFVTGDINSGELALTPQVYTMLGIKLDELASAGLLTIKVTARRQAYNASQN